MITIWTFAMLGLVFLPIGALALSIWLTWTDPNFKQNANDPHEH